MSRRTHTQCARECVRVSVRACVRVRVCACSRARARVWRLDLAKEEEDARAGVTCEFGQVSLGESFGRLRGGEAGFG